MFWNHCCSGILTQVECLIGSEESSTGNKPLMRDLLPIFGIAGHMEADSTLSFYSLQLKIEIDFNCMTNWPYKIVLIKLKNKNKINKTIQTKRSNFLNVQQGFSAEGELSYLASVLQHLWRLQYCCSTKLRFQLPWSEKSSN